MTHMSSFITFDCELLFRYVSAKQHVHPEVCDNIDSRVFNISLTATRKNCVITPVFFFFIDCVAKFLHLVNFLSGGSDM